jgi:hypothetical protein
MWMIGLTLMAEETGTQDQIFDTSELINTRGDDLNAIPDDPSDAEQDPDDDAGDVDGKDEGDGEPHLASDHHYAFIRRQNQSQYGRLSLHFPQRDVELLFDGDSALRLLTMFQNRSDRGWKDHLDPQTCSAGNGWLVLDLTLPLALSWQPLAAQPPRTAIDPT